MKCPNERLAIHNRIKAIGKQHDTFRVATCVDKHLGQHYWDDWLEVLNSMVKSGKVECITPVDEKGFGGSYKLKEVNSELPRC